MERDPGTEEYGGYTAHRDVDPGPTSIGIDIVAGIHRNENEMVLDNVRSVRERHISTGKERKDDTEGVLTRW